MRYAKCVQALFLFLPLVSLAGCGSQTGVSSLQTGSVFTMATDAPLPSVVSCQLQVDAVSLNGSGNLLSWNPIVDFAKLSGLHELVDLNSVPAGTYTSATITLDSATAPVIQIIDTSVSPPVISTVAGAKLSQTIVTVQLANPFVLKANDLVGLRMEFDIAKSLATDATGQVTGVVNPTFHLQLLNATDANVSIDDFRGGVVSVTGSNTFVLQGPHGRQWTVTTSNNTDFDTGEQPASFTLNGNTIVEVSGQLNPVTKSIDASEVEVVSTDKFLLGGLFTSIRPQPGPAIAADLYVRSELPDITGIQPGQITTLTLNGTENYRIANIRFPITSLLFGNSLLAAGQRVAVGGVINTANGTTTLLPHRIVLERQGQSGTWVANSTVIVAAPKVGSFQLNDNSTAGVLLPNPLTVLTFDGTRFINLSGLSGVSGSIRVVGFILINPSTHLPVMVARLVEQLTS